MTIGRHRVSKDKVDKVIAHGCDIFIQSRRDIIGQNRFYSISRCRLAIYKALRNGALLSFPVIGEHMERNHSTVLDGVRRCDLLIQNDAVYAKAVKRLIEYARTV